MDADGFKKWLIDNQIYRTTKLVIDCLSRAQRVEKAFQSVKPRFSFEKEYQKDRGSVFLKSISRRGVELDSSVPLPIGSNQMDSIVAATKKYFIFLADTKKNDVSQ